MTMRASNTSSSNSRSRAAYPESRYNGDTCQEAAFRASLPSRGLALSELPDRLKNPEYFYAWRKQCTKSPLQKGRTIPKLEKQGIDVYILDEMSANQLMEWICIVASLLFHSGANPMMPDWVPAE